MIILSFIRKKDLDNIGNMLEKNFTPKYRITDQVFVMHNNQICEGKIVRVDCSRELCSSEPKETILYTIELPIIKETVQLPQKLCFKSKKALKDSL